MQKQNQHKILKRVRIKVSEKVLFALWGACLDLNILDLSTFKFLIHISLNIIALFCLHIFLLILSNCRIDLMIFGGNWWVNLP